jgi:K+-sensing histidine kinase KdpD
MMLSILIAVTFLKRKAAIWLYLISVIIVSIIGLSFVNGIFEPKINIATYHSQLTAWLASLATYSLVIGLVIFIAGNIGQLLNVKLSELKSANDKLQRALKEIKTLQGILPICSYCKRIRDGQGDWEQLETYIHDHSGAKFSQSICPECIQKQHPDLYLKRD